MSDIKLNVKEEKLLCHLKQVERTDLDCLIEHFKIKDDFARTQKLVGTLASLREYGLIVYGSADNTLDNIKVQPKGYTHRQYPARLLAAADFIPLFTSK